MDTTIKDQEIENQADAPSAPRKSSVATPAIGIVGRSLLQLAEREPLSNPEPEEDEPQNRRRLPRRVGMCSTRVGLCPDGIPVAGPQREWMLAGTPISGELQDVTLGSAAFELKQQLSIGERVLLRLENREHAARVDAVGEVIRVDEKEGCFFTVCRVQPELRYEDVAALGWIPFASDVV